MTTYLESFGTSSETRSFGVATVVDLGDDANRLLVELDAEPGRTLWARRTLTSGQETCRVGDEVLVATTSPDAAFVIGIVARPVSSEAPRAASRIDASSGAWADRDGDDKLRVYSRRGELLFEYDSERERARVLVERGDLELATKDGDISLCAARQLRIDASTVDISARAAVRVALLGAFRKLRTALFLSPRGVRVSGEDVAVEADSAALSGRRVRLRSDELRGECRDARWTIERWTMRVGTLVEHARNAYRKVEELAQTQAGRIRTLVRGTLFQKARNTLLRSEEDHKVRADKIHLG